MHAAAVGNEIYLYEDGNPVTYRHPGAAKDGSEDWETPFKAAPYKWYNGRDADNDKGTNPSEVKSKWTDFVTDHFIQGNRDVRTMTCLGPEYQSGQNFQAFETVIHLDRDDWNNENMKQRTARAYRQGQKGQVVEHTIDATYEGKKEAPGQATLDEIRRLQMEMEGAIFDDIIKKSQTHPLGTEWTEIRDQIPKHMNVDEKTMQNMLLAGERD
jgi:hypothetical protein